MPRIESVPVYQFDELSDKAKERARQWYREACAGDSYWSESVIESFVDSVAPRMGWDIPKARHSRTQPAVYFSGFWSQGDGACFEGTWDPCKVDAAALKADWTADTCLHDIADKFDALKSVLTPDDCDDLPSASVKQRGHYSHEFCTEFQCYGMSAEQESDFKEASRDLMRWLYRSLEKEYEYQNSDEVVDENIRANEYEFEENGERW
jgi:hypothetical protein